MASSKSKQYPHKWSNGTWHSRPEVETDLPGTQFPAAKTPPPAPTAPTPVAAFLTGEDLASINDFNTRYATDLANIDFELTNLQTDTTYQKGQVDKNAKEQTSSATDSMAARGLFRSSIKDAALYDIEATRALSNKLLDDKLIAATLNAGTKKKILSDSKVEFDKAMAQKSGENASAVNDPAAKAWADAMATWQQKYGNKTAPAAGSPPAAAGGGNAVAPIQQPVTSHSPGSTYLTGPKKSKGPNTAQGVGNANKKGNAKKGKK